jgi:hypothetical protein
MSSLLIVRRGRRRNDLQPALGTLFNIWIVVFGFRTEIPVILLRRLLRLDVYRRLFLPVNRLLPIIIWIRGRSPPPWVPTGPDP